MHLVRFKVTVKPDKVEELRAAFAAVIDPARGTEGVLAFDIAQCLDAPNQFIATEVFTDAPAQERQESLPQVATVMALLQTGALAGPPEMARYDIAK